MARFARRMVSITRAVFPPTASRVHTTHADASAHTHGRLWPRMDAPLSAAHVLRRRKQTRHDPLQCHPRSRERGRFWSTVEHLCTELWLGALLYSSFHRVLFIRPERKYSAHTLHRDPETMNSRALNGIPHRVPVCSARRRNYFYIFAP